MQVGRAIDFIAALFLLVIFAPLLIIIGLCVRLKLGSPSIYKQQRPGLYGEPFLLVKFRTMTDTCDATGALLPDAARLTKFGRFLRSTSLDELPELWNILKGEMSFVGPRPLLMEYLPLYTPDQMRRHSVRPGITGWAQVNGRNALSWEEKFELDLWYIDHHSLRVNFRILLLTIGSVLSRSGISAGNEATMSRFLGSRSRYQ